MPNYLNTNGVCMPGKGPRLNSFHALFFIGVCSFLSTFAILMRFAVDVTDYFSIELGFSEAFLLFASSVESFFSVFCLVNQ
jgi:hypothetical protein